jgi:hypothetical protein
MRAGKIHRQLIKTQDFWQGLASFSACNACSTNATRSISENIGPLS